MDFAEDEISADDSKDEKALPSSSEDEEDDRDFIETKAKSMPSPKKDKRRVGKHAIERKRSKSKADKEATEDTKPMKEATEEAKKKRERKTFQENETLFLPMLKKLEAAIESKDTDAIIQVLRAMLDNVNSMGAPFVEQYKVSPLLKTAKGILKEHGADMSTFKELWSKLGHLYETKKRNVPTGYVPQKRETTAPKSDGKSAHGLTRSGKLTGLELRESAAASSRSQLAAQGSKVTIPKPMKKSFCLNKLLSNLDPSGSRIKSEEGARSDRKAFQKESIKNLPSWITNAPGDLCQLSSEEVERLFALEFLEGAASRFPAEEVNRESVARGLEIAIYRWSQEQYKKEDTYWSKVQAVVAGICGKTKPGTLVAAIMAGDYASAEDVVALSHDVLHRSFEG
jgi:hypothetical protein